MLQGFSVVQALYKVLPVPPLISPQKCCRKGLQLVSAFSTAKEPEQQKG